MKKMSSPKKDKRGKMKLRNPKPHFVRPLLPDFQSNFSIPKSFMKFLEDGAHKKEMNADKVAVLRGKNGDVWGVKLVFVDQKFKLKDGWLKFCNDHNLRVGNLLVFRLVGTFDFEVSIFVPSGCGCEFAPFKELENMEDGDDGKGIPETCTNPYFGFEVKPSNLLNSVIRLPTQFVRENGLSNRWCNVLLIDENGNSITRPLRCNKKKADGGNNHYIYCKRSFFKDYEINEGDHITVELLANIKGKKPVFKFYTGVTG